MSTRRQTYKEPPGVSPFPANLRDFDRPFPSTLFVLYNADEGKYIVIDAYHPTPHLPEALTDGFEGIACFRTEASARKLSLRLEDNGLPGFEPMDVDIEEARSIALGRTASVAALLLMDEPQRPIVRFVR